MKWFTWSNQNAIMLILAILTLVFILLGYKQLSVVVVAVMIALFAGAVLNEQTRLRDLSAIHPASIQV